MPTQSAHRTASLVNLVLGQACMVERLRRFQVEYRGTQRAH
jgi:hypothetical protein